MKLLNDIKALLICGLLTLGGATFLTSCQDFGDPDAFITVSQTSFTLDATGVDDTGSQPSFELRTNQDWEVRTIPDWLTLNYSSGERGVRVMHIIADANDTNESRKGCIELSTTGGKAALIFVSQARVPGSLSVSSSKFSVNLIGQLSNGAQPTFTVESTYAWTIEGSDWITASPASGDAGKTNVTLTVDPNDTQETRTGRVTVTIGEEQVDIAVTQDADCFTVSPGTLDVNIDGTATTAGSAIETTITSLEAWSVMSTPSWISLNPNNGEAGSTKVSLSVSANTETPRSGNIILVSTHGVEYSILVNQDGNLPFDNQAIGYVYFTEPFDWCHDAAEEQRLKDPSFADAMDQMNLINGSGSKNLNIYNGDGLAYAPQFYASQQGQWEVIKEYSGNDYVWILDGYIRLGASNNTVGLKTGVPLKIAAEYCANVDVQFKACKNGTDKIDLVVEIDGPGTIVDGQNSKLSKVLTLPNQDSSKKWEWQNLSVKIAKATADTRILIRPTVMDDYNKNSAAKYQRRWLIDDVNVLRIAN